MPYCPGFHHLQMSPLIPQVVPSKTSFIGYMSPSGFHYSLYLYIFLIFPLNFFLQFLLYPFLSLHVYYLSPPPHPLTPTSFRFLSTFPATPFTAISNAECRPVKFTFQLNFQSLSIRMGLYRKNATMSSLLQIALKMVTSGPTR